MSASDREDEAVHALRAMTSLEWVADLPTLGVKAASQGESSRLHCRYTRHRSLSSHPQGSSTSIISRFSLFSIFRSAPAVPQDGSLESLFALAHDDHPTAADVTAALDVFGRYVEQLQKSSDREGMTERDKESVEGQVAGLMECYMIVIKSVCALENLSPGGTSDILRQAVPASFRGLFTIYNHVEHSTRGVTARTVQLVQKHLLASPHHVTAMHDHLTPLYCIARDAIRALQHSVRTTQGKPLRADADEEGGMIQEDSALCRMQWLRLYAEHLRGLAGLPVFGVEKAVVMTGKGKQRKPKKMTKVEIKQMEEERSGRPVRIALEADLLRCDLALSMATAHIGAVKHRAKAAVDEITTGSGASEEGVEDGKNPTVESEARARKRRALTAESDWDAERDETVDKKPVIPGGGSAKGSAVEGHEAEDDADGLEHMAEALAINLGTVKWEKEVESSLLDVLYQMKQVVDDRNIGILSDKIERCDWINDGALARHNRNSPSYRAPAGRPASVAPATKRGTATVGGKQSADDSESGSGEEVSSADEDEDDEEDEADLSHPCPLRTLFRLHDRYEEQRLAVWLSLPHEKRGRMGAYMRGEDGEVGAAWDALGLGLLMVYDSDSLDAYGLSPDKLDKWVELAARRNAKKIRKRARRTA